MTNGIAVFDSEFLAGGHDDDMGLKSALGVVKQHGLVSQLFIRRMDVNFFGWLFQEYANVLDAAVFSDNQIA